MVMTNENGMITIFPRAGPYISGRIIMPKKLLAALALLASGCASTFHPINHEAVEYTRGPADSSGLAVQYHYNVLDESGNSLYATKAREQGLSMVAVKIKNNTGREVGMRDVDFYTGNNVVTPANPATMASVRQRSGLYTLYLLMMLVNGYKTEVTCSGYGGCQEETSFIPIGVIIGPVVMLINVAMAATANDALVKEATDNSILDKTLKPGETASGYLILRDAGQAPISARVRNP
jgi:hypothetical protein